MIVFAASLAARVATSYLRTFKESAVQKQVEFQEPVDDKQ
jgi:hypothetical protein